MNSPTKPPVEPVERASVWVQLRVRKSDKVRWAALAKRDGVSLSSWIKAHLNSLK